MGKKIINKLITHEHHIIPVAVARDHADALKAIGWNNEAASNFKKLKAPFHGNHRSYSREVSRRIQDMKNEGALNVTNMHTLVKDLRREINQAWKEYQKGGGNLNSYFKKHYKK